MEKDKNNPTEGELIVESGKQNPLTKGGNVVIGTLNVMTKPVLGHIKNRHEKFYKAKPFHLWADLFFVLSILSLFSVFVIIKNLEPKPEIDLSSVVVSPKVVSGDLTTIEVSYRNNGKVAVQDASLSIVFPEDFSLVAASPEKIFSDQTNTFTIGDLPRGANGKITITGSLLGGLGDKKSFSYSLNYLRKGYEYNKLGSLNAIIESSALETTLKMQDKIYENTNFGGVIVLKNNGRVDIDRDITLSFEGKGLNILSISGSNAVLINDVIIQKGLKAGQEASIKFQASPLFKNLVDLSLVTNIDFGYREVKQSEIVSSVAVLPSKIAVNINAKQSQVKIGDLVKFELDISGNSDEKLDNVEINLYSANDYFSLRSLSLEKDSQYAIKGTVISLPSLNNNKVKLPIEVIFDKNKNVSNQEVGLVADILYNSSFGKGSYRVYSENVKIFSDLLIASKAVYYSAQGDQLGVGPLPPVVGVPTKYWVFWELDNNGNELKDLSVSAELPANVGWTNQKSLLSGSIHYSPISRQVVWSVDNVLSSAGQYKAGFEVELIPTASDAGKTPKILTNIKYSAADAFVQSDISGTLNDLDTNLKDDKLSAGKGTVIKMEIVK
jgi:hypothetical protein